MLIACGQHNSFCHGSLCTFCTRGPSGNTGRLCTAYPLPFGRPACTSEFETSKLLGPSPARKARAIRGERSRKRSLLYPSYLARQIKWQTNSEDRCQENSFAAKVGVEAAENGPKIRMLERS